MMHHFENSCFGVHSPGLYEENRFSNGKIMVEEPATETTRQSLGSDWTF